jgi:hypothetical protein
MILKWARCSKSARIRSSPRDLEQLEAQQEECGSFTTKAPTGGRDARGGSTLRPLPRIAAQLQDEYRVAMGPEAAWLTRTNENHPACVSAQQPRQSFSPRCGSSGERAWWEGSTTENSVPSSPSEHNEQLRVLTPRPVYPTPLNDALHPGGASLDGTQHCSPHQSWNSESCCRYST